MFRGLLIDGLVVVVFGVVVTWAPRLVAEEENRKGAPETSALEPSVALGRATGYYETGKYQECADAFSELLGRPETAEELGPRGVERARIYYAACLFATGNADQADEQFRAAILSNPQIATPSSIIFPQVIVDRFLLVRASLLEELRRAQEERARRAREAARRAAAAEREEARRIRDLERLAAQETVVVKNSRWLASLPFGVGQFQNRDYTLGAMFLTSEVLLLGSAITATSIQLSLHAQAAGRQLSPPEHQNINTNLDVAQKVIMVSTAGFLGISALGIVEAHLSFVPEFREGARPRASPKVGKPKPRLQSGGLVPLPGGAAFGMSGSF